MTAAERQELLHLPPSQEEADTKLILHSHKILKEGSSKVVIHSPSSDTDILLLTSAHLYKSKERIYIINSHGNGKYKNIRKTKQYYLL